MAGLLLAAFSGMAPRVGKQLLKDNEAQIAKNTVLTSGELRALNKPSALLPRALVAPGTKSIYRHVDTLGSDVWLSSVNDVDVVQGPIFASGENPIYLTGLSSPQKTNSIFSPSGIFLEMGVPNPTTAPTVSASGGSGASTSRVYLYTFISQFGSIEEESGPSPTSAIVNVLNGGTVTVSGLPAAAPTGAYNITKIRIYRQATGSQSDPFLKVADVNIGVTSFVDNVTATGLGQVLPSASYEPPPSDLKGLVAMANGILAGFRGNEVYFSEPFLPHAWPSIYSLTVEFPIVGLAAFGESLLVATTGTPFLITGSNPAAMSQSKLAIYEPCVSKRSIVADRDGAQYASPNGIVRIAQGFAGLVTKSLFTRDDWQFYNPSSMVGAMLDGSYYLFYSKVVAGEISKACLILDADNAGAAVTESSLYTDAIYIETTTASMYVVDEDEIKLWEGDNVNFLPYEWRSKAFVLPRPLNFGAVQVDAAFEDIGVGERLQQQIAQIKQENQQTFQSSPSLLGAINAHAVNGKVLNGSILKDVPTGVDGRYVILRAYCEERLVATLSLTSRKAMRLPSGFKGDRWEFELLGNVPLRTVRVAETSKELMQL